MLLAAVLGACGGTEAAAPVPASPDSDSTSTAPAATAAPFPIMADSIQWRVRRECQWASAASER